MHITLTKAEVDAIDLTHLAHFLQWNPTYQQYFVQEAGKEPFKLIAFLSKKIGGVAMDMGTLFGSSALALSYNDSTQVMTLDTRKHIPDTQDVVTPLNRPNIRMLVASCQAVLPHASSADFIVLDIDINLKTEILKVINELLYYNFRGILVLDNIHVNQNMEYVWQNIPATVKKIDVSTIGHHTGTGILVYDPSHIDITMD
jgi:predicted O-methyltransferase YrrM